MLLRKLSSYFEAPDPHESLGSIKNTFDARHSAMWLIDVETRKLEEFFGLDTPHYAILSHTWNRGQEVSFQEMRAAAADSPLPGSRSPPKSGWRKIDMTCRQAAEEGLQYAWVDTCCIDKSSSAELSEAINSMFRWYERAAVCYVYLSDLAFVTAAQLNTGHCRWFSRSWTLQEMVAPANVKFYNRDWEFCFSKASASAVLSRITGVNIDVLEHRMDLSEISVAQKMSWAAKRQATRIEDLAYSLLGLFGINMPLLYGEEEKAFLRLQTEIVNSFPDPTIFAWMLPGPQGWESPSGGVSETNMFSGVMAWCPKLFKNCGELERLTDQVLMEMSMSNRGIKLRAQFGLRKHAEGYAKRGLVLPVCHIQGRAYGIWMRNTGRGCFVRQNPHGLVAISPWNLTNRLMLEPFLMTQLSCSAGSRAMNQQPRSLILESRQRVLEIVLAPGMDVYRRWPWLQWDESDTLFFGNQAPLDDIGWAALKVVASPNVDYPNLSNAGTSVDFLFYAFGWAREPELNSEPRCTVHRVYGRVEDRGLEQMNHEAVKDSWNAYWVANRLVMNGVREESSLVAGTFEENTVFLKSTVQLVEDPQVCMRPFWRITFDWSVVPATQVSQALSEDRGWKGIDWGLVWR